MITKRDGLGHSRRRRTVERQALPRAHRDSSPKATHYIIVAFTMHVNIYISNVLAIELI